MVDVVAAVPVQYELVVTWLSGWKTTTVSGWPDDVALTVLVEAVVPVHAEIIVDWLEEGDG